MGSDTVMVLKSKRMLPPEIEQTNKLNSISANLPVWLLREKTSHFYGREGQVHQHRTAHSNPQWTVLVG